MKPTKALSPIFVFFLLFVLFRHTTPVISAVGPSFTRLVVAQTGPTYPVAKQMADLDGDGFMDMIVGSQTSGAFWYHYPDWTKRTIATVTETESGSAIVDIVGDGYPDIIVGASWFENPRRTGGSVNGAWVERASFAATAGTHDIRGGDLDGDGRLDIVMRGETKSIVSIFKQVSKTVWIQRNIDPGLGLAGVQLVDIDQDGKLDIVVGGRWMRNPGDIINGTWTVRTFGTWDPFAAIDSADMNGDGRPDILLEISDNDGKISWFENPPNPLTAGNWIEHVVETVADSSHNIAAVDVDLDGDLDIVISEYIVRNRLMVYYNDGTGNFTPVVLGTPALHNLVVGDYDNDGDPDFLGAQPWYTPPVELWRNELRTGPSSPTKILVFHKTTASVHDSIPDGMQMLRSLGARDNFLVTESVDPTVFSDANLAQFSALVFLNPSGSDLFTAAQQSAIKNFVESGKGFVGIHNAADLAFPLSPQFGVWYEKLVGASRVSEIAPQPMTFQVLDHLSASTSSLPLLWSMFTSDIYNWNVNPKVNGATVLVNLDDTSVGGPMGADHPVSWSHAYDGGRSWYTTAGGGIGEYHTPLFKEHVGGGLKYAIGVRGAAAITPMIALSASSGSVNETDATVTLTATRTGGATGAVSVDFATGDGTAKAGSDYLGTAGTLFWASGDSSPKTILLTVFTDAAVEPNETFAVSLSNPIGGVVLGSPSTATVTILDSSNGAPTIATPAAASPSPATGTTASLSVLGADDGGEPALTYTWATTGTPPAAVSFSANGTNAARNTVASFTKAGNYNVLVTLKDSGNTMVTSSVSVTVTPVLTSITVAPGAASVGVNTPQLFTAIARDQFGTALASQPGVTWTVSGGGTIDSGGTFTAGASVGGPFTVTASTGGLHGTATVTITIVNTAPTVATAAAASPSPVTSTTTGLSVLGADDGGESSLTYTWATTGVPPAAVAFSANGTNAAKNITATFTKAGPYTFQVTIKDAGNLTAISSINVVISQTLTGIGVLPSAATVAIGGLQAFTASATDQFNAAMSPQPAITWAVTGGGSINATGLFTAGGSTGGPFTVRATSGAVSGAASVSVVTATLVTIGQTTVLANKGSGDANALQGIKASLAQNATIQSLSVNFKAVSGQCILSIYADNGSNYPGALKAQTAAFTPAVGWSTQNVTAPTLLTAGNYWLIWQTNNAGMGIAYASGGTTIAKSATYGTPPATFPTGGGSNYDNSIYATLLPAVTNAAPTVAGAAAANPSTATGTTTNVSVMGADDGGEPGLTYTWATTGTPPAAVTFSPNGSNAAKNAVATFTKAGTYSFQVTIKDAGNLTTTSSVNVTVNQTLTTIGVSPGSASVPTNGTQLFAASARDQFAATLSALPAFTWSVDTGGTIGAGGLFTAGGTAGGPFTITAASGATNGTASVTVTPVNSSPTVATAAAASPSPATGTTTNLSVLGADDTGEPSLIYTWATTGTPPAAVTFSTNGSNAAKNAVATFTKAGAYSFQVTIKDASNLTTTSTVNVTAAQTLTGVAVTPPSASVITGGTQQYTASATDQFGAVMTTQPALTWSVTGGGNVSGTGLFTAGATAGGPFSVRAINGAISGTATVTVVGSSSLTIGQTAVLAGMGSGDANRMQGIKATLAQSATLQSLSVYFKGTSGSALCMLSIYADNGSNYPGALKAQTAAFTIAVGWNTKNVAVPVSLPAGTYWLIWQTNNNSAGIAYAAGGTTIDVGQTYATPPSSFPGGGQSNYDNSIYATFSVPAPAPDPTAEGAATVMAGGRAPADAEGPMIRDHRQPAALRRR